MGGPGLSRPARCSEPPPPPRMERIRAKQEKHRQSRAGRSRPQEPQGPPQEPGECEGLAGPRGPGVRAAGTRSCLVCAACTRLSCATCSPCPCGPRASLPPSACTRGLSSAPHGTTRPPVGGALPTPSPCLTPPAHARLAPPQGLAVHGARPRHGGSGGGPGWTTPQVPPPWTRCARAPPLLAAARPPVAVHPGLSPCALSAGPPAPPRHAVLTVWASVQPGPHAGFVLPFCSDCHESECSC